MNSILSSSVSLSQAPQYYSDNKAKPTSALSEPNISDLEGHYFVNFQEAYLQSDPHVQICNLEKLGQLFLERRKHTEAAQLINTAIKIAIDNKLDSIHSHLNTSLEKIEFNFLIEELRINLPRDYQSRIQIRRERLERIRALAQLQLNESEPGTTIQAFLTEGFRNLIRATIEESILLLSPPSTSFAVFLLGSCGRGEMCPYSDIEFAFCLKTSSEDNKTYFRRLARIVELQVILLGETKFKILRLKDSNQKTKEKSLLPGGFSMDIGGLAPIGKMGVYELIGSPGELALFESPDWIAKNDGETILSNAMVAPTYLMGDEELLQDYQREVRKHLIKTHKERAKSLLEGHIKEFQPCLSNERVEIDAFNVKKDFYRPFQMIIEALALFYLLEKTSTVDRITELKDRKIISNEGARNLCNALQIALTFRIRLQLFFQEENENMSRAPEEEGGRWYPIKEQETASLIEIHRILLPFHQAAEDFVEGKSPSFRKSKFYKKSIGKKTDRNSFSTLLSIIFLGTDREDHAASAALTNDEYSIQAVALNTEGDKTALALRALEVCREKHGAHFSTMECLNTLGKIYVEQLEEYEVGQGYYQEAYEMGEIILADLEQKWPKLREELYKLTNANSSKKGFSEAKSAMYKTLYGSANAKAGIADALFLGKAHDAKEALSWYQQAIDLYISAVAGGIRVHPVARCYHKMGVISCGIGDIESARDYYKKALSAARFLPRMGDFKKRVKAKLKALDAE